MRATAVCLLLALAAPAAWAQVPDQMVFQGQLVRTDGTPEEGSHDLRFALYDAATGGNVLWEETHVGVEVKGGRYQVVLGTVTTGLQAVFTGEVRYLSVGLEGQAEQLPRLPVSTLPYAFTAGDSARLGGQPASDFSKDGHGHPNATTSSAGFLSASDKAKLDALPATPSLQCQRVSDQDAFDSGATATCPSGYLLTGGGCEDLPQGTGFTTTAMPTSSNGYLCRGNGSTAPSSQVTAWAVCCRVVP